MADGCQPARTGSRTGSDESVGCARRQWPYAPAARVASWSAVTYDVEFDNAVRVVVVGQ